MKLFGVILCLGIATALPQAEQRLNGENGWYVPQADGSSKWLNMAEAKALLAAKEREESRIFDTNVVKFYLYTKANPTEEIEILPTNESLNAAGFKPNNPVKFTIHGWNSNYRDGVNSGPRRAWLTHGDMNMIAVDWARGRSLEYASSVAAIPGAGSKIGAMIDFMHMEYKIPLARFEVIGHSLGAHVAGFAGKSVKSGQIQSVVGLDPAMPLFSYENAEKRLASTDAFYVESIQTNGGKKGFLKPIGKGAFYPNGGKLQPGCGTDLDGGCSHARSVSYYVEAVEFNDFPTMKCGSYTDAVGKECGSTYSSVRMGAMGNVYMVSGSYYVPVNDAKPFGFGAN